MTNRRSFITLLGSAVTAWPLAAHAQQSERMRRVGVIMAMREKDPQAQLNLEAFRQGLKALGLEDGLNVRIDYRFGANEPGLIRAVAADILALAPDVILTHGTEVTTGVSQQTRTVPVVFTVVSDPVGSGFVESFPRPGGNLTGFTNFLEPSFAAKWIELLNEIRPASRASESCSTPGRGPAAGCISLSRPRPQRCRWGSSRCDCRCRVPPISSGRWRRLPASLPAGLSRRRTPPPIFIAG
jgi:ABC-type uncharacterized transport system substrate-binding protein